MQVLASTLTTPLGPLQLVARPDGVLVSARFLESAGGSGSEHGEICGALGEATLQRFLDYFAGDWEAPKGVESAAVGTAFQRRVWDRIAQIPPGQTKSYADLARELGTSGASRAVGIACGANPLLLAIPCHRVVGSDGALRGYAGGIERKAWLLSHEGARSGQLALGACANAAGRDTTGP